MRDGAEGATYWRLAEAARLLRLPPSRIRRYVQAGLVQPVVVDERGLAFGRAELARLRKIRRLVDALGLNPAGLEIVLRLLDDIEMLQRELERASRDQTTAGPRETRQGDGMWPSIRTS